MTKSLLKKFTGVVIIAVMTVTAGPAVSTAVTAKADEASHNAKIESDIEKATTTKINDFRLTFGNSLDADYDWGYDEDHFRVLDDLRSYQLSVKPVAKVHYKKDGRKIDYDGQTYYSPWSKTEYALEITDVAPYSRSYNTSDTRAGDFTSKKLKNGKVKLTILSNAQGWKKGKFYFLCTTFIFFFKDSSSEAFSYPLI